MNKSQYAEAIESQQTKKLLSGITYSIALCVIAFGTWSAVTQVDEIAKAKGTVVPEGERQIIQSDIGGKLKTISVAEGDMVEEGQVLVEFDATFQTTALEELKAQQASLNLTIERLSSLIDEREPNFDLYQSQYPELVAQQRAQRANCSLLSKTDSARKRGGANRRTITQYRKSHSSLRTPVKRVKTRAQHTSKRAKKR